uniref:Uncharacterized protein n=1 Tax=Arundo donax TaxID=35708 RepID=A0A0A9FSR4_ARUDO
MNKITQHKILNQLTVSDPWISRATTTRIQEIYGFFGSGALPNRASLSHIHHRAILLVPNNSCIHQIVIGIKS